MNPPTRAYVALLMAVEKGRHAARKHREACVSENPESYRARALRAEAKLVLNAACDHAAEALFDFITEDAP